MQDAAHADFDDEAILEHPPLRFRPNPPQLVEDDLFWLIPGNRLPLRFHRPRLPIPGGLAVLEHGLDILHGRDGNLALGELLRMRPPYGRHFMLVLKTLGAYTICLVFFVTVPMLFALHLWGSTGTVGAFALGAALWYPLVFREAIPEAESRASFLAELRSLATFVGVALKVRRVRHCCGTDARGSSLSLADHPPNFSSQVAALLITDAFFIPAAVGYWLSLVTSEARGVTIASILATQPTAYVACPS